MKSWFTPQIRDCEVEKSPKPLENSYFFNRKCLFCAVAPIDDVVYDGSREIDNNIRAKSPMTVEFSSAYTSLSVKEIVIVDNYYSGNSTTLPLEVKWNRWVTALHIVYTCDMIAEENAELCLNGRSQNVTWSTKSITTKFVTTPNLGTFICVETTLSSQDISFLTDQGYTMGSLSFVLDYDYIGGSVPSYASSLNRDMINLNLVQSAIDDNDMSTIEGSIVPAVTQTVQFTLNDARSTVQLPGMGAKKGVLSFQENLIFPADIANGWRLEVKFNMPHAAPVLHSSSGFSYLLKSSLTVALGPAAPVDCRLINDGVFRSHQAKEGQFLFRSYLQSNGTCTFYLHTTGANPTWLSFETSLTENENVKLETVFGDAMDLNAGMDTYGDAVNVNGKDLDPQSFLYVSGGEKYNGNRAGAKSYIKVSLEVSRSRASLVPFFLKFRIIEQANQCPYGCVHGTCSPVVCNCILFNIKSIFHVLMQIFCILPALGFLQM
jgi:hypothetical protein